MVCDETYLRAVHAGRVAQEGTAVTSGLEATIAMAKAMERFVYTPL